MKMKFYRGLMLAGLTLLLLTACSTAAGPTEDPLAGTAWELIAYRKSRPIPGSVITAVFEDGQVRGTTGCNSYSGPYQVDGDRIAIGPLAVTEMACLEPAGPMEQEALFREYLGTVDTIWFV